MDKKDNNSGFTGDPLNWKSLGFFSAQEYLLYVFKKTEKITAALYLVSGLLKDDEPMKWELRDHGMDLMSSSFMASSNMPGDKSSVIQSLFTAALETISLLNVAKISNLISEMNHTLLVREIDGIVAMLRDRLAENAENAGYVLSENFFRTPDMFSTGFKAEGTRGGRGQEIGNKGQGALSTRPEQGKTKILEGHTTVQAKKDSRQEAIINVLKGQSNLTIKDFSKVIKDCSEKTIQRELIDLVDRGVVKKEGERRWSRYSLN
ncbi:MAG: hypothetical protein KBC33_03625 [Candidatus Pacebacteria bacterium]|nr:hypothetical protein [Candidatus Paceibacterota bacterium]